MAFGVTPAGFVAKRQSDIVADIQKAFRDAFGQNQNFLPTSVESNIINIFSERLAEVWELGEADYNAYFPATAEGVSLDNVGSISGIPRLPALPSVQRALRLFGTPGTTVPSGTLFSVTGNPAAIFSTNNSVTLGTAQDEVQRIAFGAVPTSGQWQVAWNGGSTPLLAHNANAAAVQVAIRTMPFAAGALVTGDYTAGFAVDFAGVSGNQPWPLVALQTNTLQASATPVTVTVSRTQSGVVAASVDCTCTQNGPTVANAGTLTVINTPITGLTSSLNVIDAVAGRNTESDTDYRARRAQELQIAGAGTFEAIRAKLQGLTGVTAVVMFENDTDITDVSGRPPHTFEAVVQGGADQDVIDELWVVKPTGISPTSTATGPAKVTGSTLDSQGQSHTLVFSRPTTLSIYVEVDVTKDATFPANGAASVRAAVLAAGNALGIGKEVVVVPYLIAALAPIPGIQTAVIKIGTAPSPTLSNNINVAPNEIAVFDSSRINVVVT